ncbi:MAG: DPP IV N-terminal domain-containing protein [Candidatus Cryptobacteroides sp.]
MKNCMTAICLALSVCAAAQAGPKFPAAWKWVGEDELAVSFDASFNSPEDYVVNARTRNRVPECCFPEVVEELPFFPEDSSNPTLSPDGRMIAFTRGNDLWVAEVSTGKETRLTSDGSATILNGYASWVYYEEIFGRPSRYRAFWWSPDSRRIGFYRFDNSEVPVFPIYSSYPEDYDRSDMGLSYTQKAGAAVPLEGVSPTGGSVRMTRYPKCGDNNPKVRIGIADIETGSVTWADFDEAEDQYFGTPFWGADSKTFFVQREPRTQNKLDLYAVSSEDGSKKCIYHEEYATWLDWIDGMIFGKNGLYMVRSFETSWQQIYYLSYDGSVFTRLTDGQNWRMSLVDVDEKGMKRNSDGRDASVLFIAERDSRVSSGLYRACKGEIKPVSTPLFHVSRVKLSPSRKYAAASISRCNVPDQLWIFNVSKPSQSFLLADSAEGLETQSMNLPEVITMTTHDGFTLPALICYPEGFDPARKYPVHMDIYGGPDTPQVRDAWAGSRRYDWYARNGIIEIVADCRASGHNGREGLDMIYGRLSEVEVQDFVEWAEYLQGLPYVQGDKIGVEGFSFGGTMTAILVMDHPEAFHYGIAGGGVYDWSLYDTHYTERFMDTPANNPEGYARTRAVSHAVNYPVKYGEDDGSVMLKLTHGTGDDNVHFQNTLMLADALHKAGCKFELMIYPDGMHGYRGYQGEHFQAANREFWLKYLKGGQGENCNRNNN